MYWLACCIYCSATSNARDLLKQNNNNIIILQKEANKWIRMFSAEWDCLKCIFYFHFHFVYHTIYSICETRLYVRFENSTSNNGNNFLRLRIRTARALWYLNDRKLFKLLDWLFEAIFCRLWLDSTILYTRSLLEQTKGNSSYLIWVIYIYIFWYHFIRIAQICVIYPIWIDYWIKIHTNAIIAMDHVLLQLLKDTIPSALNISLLNYLKSERKVFHIN